MKTHLSHTLFDAVHRIVEAPERALSRVAARFSVAPTLAESTPTTDHLPRLERVFEALSELPEQHDVASALELACDTLQAELPSQAMAAGIYDINADEVRLIAARGLEQDLLRGTILPRQLCFMGRASDGPYVVDSSDVSDWLGSGESGAQTLVCPVTSEAHLLGVIAVADPLCAACFDDHDVELVRYVADQVASFIQGARQRASLHPPRT